MRYLAIAAAIVAVLPSTMALAQTQQNQTQGYIPGQPSNYNQERMLRQLENDSQPATPTTTTAPTPTPTPTPSSSSSSSDGGWQDGGASRGPH